MLETEYLKRPLIDGPAPATPTQPGDHVGVNRQKDGRFFVGLSAVAGRVSGSNLVKLADLAEAHGSYRLRTTPMQKILVLDVAGDQVDSLVAGAEALGLSARPDAWRRSVMACTGIEFCKLAIVETKAQAARVVEELETRLGALDSPDHRAHQRLPQLLRPDPGGRHRAEGPAGARARTATRSRASRSTWAAGSGWTPASAASCAATR